MERPRISVIIPVFGREELLLRCLSSLKKEIQGEIAHEVSVVDDGSGIDGEKIREQVQPDYPLIWNSFSENRGRSAARNEAIANSSGAIIVFMDSDTEAFPGFLEAHELVHAANSGCVAIGLLKWDGKGSWTKYCSSRGIGKLKKGDPVPSRYFTTANASVEREYLPEKPFNESLVYWGGEDLDLALRLEKKEIKFFKAEEAVCFHNHVTPLKEHLARTENYGLKILPIIVSSNPTLEHDLKLDLLSTFFWRAISSRIFSVPLAFLAKMLDKLILPDTLYDLLIWSAYSRGWMESKK